jgi:hypothetical protein
MSKSPFVASLVVAFASITLSAQVHLGAVRIGSTSESVVTVTITNPGTLASISVVTGGAADMDFTKSGNGTCKVGKTYQVNDTCTVKVSFSPTLAGNRQGGVSLADGNSNPMATVYLKGDGLGPQAAFGPATQAGIFSNLNNVADLSVDASGNVYAAESETYPSYNPGAPEIPGGVFKATYEGGNQYTVSNIGNTLVDPVGVAVDGDGNVLEADAILDSWISPEQGTVTSLPGFFHGEQSLAVDAAGNIYSAGYGSVYKSSPAFAGTQTYTAVVTGLGDIGSIAVNGAGDLFIPNSGAEPAVYKETLTKDGYIQTQIGSGWLQPAAVAVDGNGIVYVSDSGTIYSETPRADGTYVRAAVLASQNNGTSPGGLAVDGDGNLYVPVYAGAGPFGSFFNVDKFDRSEPPVLTFATTTAGSTSSDSPRTVTVSNLGTEPLQFYGIHYPAAFPESKQWSAGRCTADTTLAVGATCNIVIDFSPVSEPSGGSASQTVTDQVEIFTNTLGAPGTRQLIPVTGTKTKEPTAQIPVISKSSGTYNASQTLSFSDATPGAVIYYTLDGKTPSETTGIRYAGPGTLNTSATVKAIAYAPGYAPSPVVTASYRLVVAQPTISPASGSFKGPVTVTIAGATPGATIFYTTKGNLPTTSSTVYTGPFTISGDERVIAIAAKTGFTASATAEQTYKLASSQK